MVGRSLKWPDRMSPTDALFWFMGKLPERRSTIGGLVILKRSPSREQIRRELEGLSASFPRMRQRVLEVPFALSTPEWIEDAQLDLDYHLREVAVPAPGDLEALLAELSPLYATPFYPNRPLWEAYVAEGLGGGRGALFFKMHHCITDGVGGVGLCETLLDKRARRGRSVRHGADAPRSTNVPAVMGRAVFSELSGAAAVGRDTMRLLAGAAGDPAGMVTGLGRGLRAARGIAGELASWRAGRPLDQRRSLSRQMATVDMTLSDIDRVRQRVGATLNDVILTIVSGAMHRWQISRGQKLSELRALIPVSLRDAGDLAPGNRVALLGVTLPMDEPNPLRRLRIIQEHMRKVKNDRRAMMYPWLARAMNALPQSIAEQLGRRQTARTSLVCANVPGPRRACTLAGQAIQAIYPYAPLGGDHPVAITLCSYCNDVFVGIDVDTLAMRDLPRFKDAFREAYEDMLSVGRPAAVARPRRRARRGRPAPRRGAA